MSVHNQLDEIDLNDVEGFWSRPIEEREAAFDELRRRPTLPFFPEPVFGDLPPGPGYYVVTRLDDLNQMTRDNERFISGKGTGNIVDLPPEMMAEFGESLITMDGARHRRLRRIVARAFTPSAIAHLGDDVARIAGNIVDDIIGRGECDAVSDIAEKLPLRVICDLVGVPDKHYDLVLAETDKLLGLADPDYVSPGADPIAVMTEASAVLSELMHELTTDPEVIGSDNLITRLTNAELDGEVLTKEELASFFILLVSAGSETTRNAISWGIDLLSRFPKQRERWLRDVDGVMPTAIEEILRWSSPVMCQRRTIHEEAEPVEVGGSLLQPGDKVLMFHWAANRDPAHFEDANQFDVLRSPNPHVALGAPGVHYCLGAHLARLELEVIFRELLTRIPDVRVAGDMVRLRSSLVNGVKQLPISFTPSPTATGAV